MVINANYLAGRRKILPGRATVTYAVGPSFGTTASIVDAVKKPLELSEFADAGVSIGETACKWILWTALLTAASITPKVGDKITDASSVAWSVQHIEKNLLEQKVTLYCVRQRGNS